MQKQKRDLGFSLIEVVVAITVFITVAIPASFVIATGISHRSEEFTSYTALSAMRDAIAEIQNVANMDQDLGAQEGIGAVYDRYHGETISLSSVPGATLSIECYASETAVPSDLGGPQDLNFDGDAQDDLSNLSNGSDLKLVPMTLTLVYPIGGSTVTLVQNRLITKSSD